MNIDKLKQKIDEYYKNATPEQIVKELEDMGVNLVDLNSKEHLEILLRDIKEDKHQNLSTTSFKFKTDLWDFCIQNEHYATRIGWKEDLKNFACVEYGTHKGQTTRILANLFKSVYTFNLPNHFDAAKELNQDLDNISYIGLDLYNSDVYEPLIDEPISLFFIDAVHSYDAVMSDFTRSLNIGPLAKEVFFVFDDYGSYHEVKKAIEDLIWVNKLEIVKFIGHEPGHDFGQGRILQDFEGVICRLIK